MAFACIYVPDFPAQAATRAEAPGQSAPAVAIFDGPEALLQVVACNQEARRRGIAPGMSRQQAELCAGVILRKRRPELEEAAQSALVDCGYGFSPRVESTGSGIVMVDLSGSRSLWGAPREVGAELLRRTASEGFEAHIAIAANPDAALCAARGFPGVVVIPSGEEAASLAPLAIQHLGLREEVLETLKSWGIGTFHALASLPPLPLTERLGQEGLHLWRLARGQVQREIVPLEPDPSFAESADLEEPVERLEPLAVVLRQLLERIASRLAERSLGTGHLRVEMELEVHRDSQAQADFFPEPRVLFQRSLQLPVPTQDPGLLLKLLQLDLAAHPPEGPVQKIILTAEPEHIRYAQTGLFQPLAPEPGQLEIALARLRAVAGEQDELGRGRVGAPVLLDSHRPDSFAMEPFGGGFSAVSRAAPSSPKLVLRRFRPALKTRAQGDSVPTSLVFDGAKAEVVTCAGPWKSSGSWWEEGREWRREEWDAVLKIQGGYGLYRLFRDPRSSQWFVEGIYD